MRIVLDTNIIVSRYLTPHGRVARIIDLWEQGAFDLLASGHVLSEYARVLGYTRLRRVHRLTDAELAEIIESFREFVKLVEPVETPAVVYDDPDDDHFFACAESGGDDVLVTADPHLLKIGTYEEVAIVSPADFLNRFFPE